MGTHTIPDRPALRLSWQPADVDRRLEHLDGILRSGFALKRRIIEGLEPASLHGHGLDGMRHRVESAGGQLTVESSPGRGTCICATLPKLARPGAAH